MGGRAPLLHVNDLTIGKAPHERLSGINFSAGQGEIIGIIGPNGAGKSTLMRAISGLLAADDGEILLDGQDIGALSDRARAHMISYLPQYELVHWPVTVERQVALGRLPYLGAMGKMTEVDHLLVEAAIEQCQLQDLRHRPMDSLSGGERARALLARAMAVGSPILAVDEPLAALDPAYQHEMMALLSKEARSGRLVIVIIHDLNIAQLYCDRLLLLHKGQAIGCDVPRRILSPTNISMVYNMISNHVTLDDGSRHLLLRSR